MGSGVRARHAFSRLPGGPGDAGGTPRGEGEGGGERALVRSSLTSHRSQLRGTRACLPASRQLQVQGPHTTVPPHDFYTAQHVALQCIQVMQWAHSAHGHSTVWYTLVVGFLAGLRKGPLSMGDNPEFNIQSEDFRHSQGSEVRTGHLSLGGEMAYLNSFQGSEVRTGHLSDSELNTCI